MMRSRPQTNHSLLPFASMKFLQLTFLVLFITLIPVGVHAETYTRTLDASDVGKYALEIRAQLKGETCYDLTFMNYPTKEACTATLAKMSSVAGNVVIDSCSQISKKTYEYSFPGPACADSVSAYSLTLKSGSATSGTPSTGSTGGGGSTGITGGGGSKGTTGGGGGGGETLKNPLKFNSLPELISGILSGVVQLGAILLVFMLVYVGFLFVMAQGNPEKVSAARSALVWTVIGGLILLGAEAISKVIEATVQSISS